MWIQNIWHNNVKIILKKDSTSSIKSSKTICIEILPMQKWWFQEVNMKIISYFVSHFQSLKVHLILIAASFHMNFLNNPMFRDIIGWLSNISYQKHGRNYSHWIYSLITIIVTILTNVGSGLFEMSIESPNHLFTQLYGKLSNMIQGVQNHMLQYYISNI
jgi:hypothetical protein